MNHEAFLLMKACRKMAVIYDYKKKSEVVDQHTAETPLSNIDCV